MFLKRPRNEESYNPPDIEDEEQSPENFEAIEDKYEEAEIDTLADFIEVLKNNYDKTEDKEVKRLLAHQIIKIEISLSKTNPPLSKTDVKIRQAPEGVLGYYIPTSGEIAIDRDLIQDFNTEQKLITHVLVHENLHKSGISDEGMVELKVKKLIDPVPGIYEHEQAHAKTTFYQVGMDKALDLYDIDDPTELTVYYLEVELEKKWNERLKQDFINTVEKDKMEPKKVLEGVLQSYAEELEDEFEDGVERLYKKLKAQGFQFADESLGLLEKIARDDFDTKKYYR